jgi:hypothetical protein
MLLLDMQKNMFDQLEATAKIYCQLTNLIFIDYMNGIYNGLQRDPDFDLDHVLSILIRDHKTAVKNLQPKIKDDHPAYYPAVDEIKKKR